MLVFFPRTTMLALRTIASANNRAPSLRVNSLTFAFALRVAKRRGPAYRSTLIVEAASLYAARVPLTARVSRKFFTSLDDQPRAVGRANGADAAYLHTYVHPQRRRNARKFTDSSLAREQNKAVGAMPLISVREPTLLEYISSRRLERRVERTNTALMQSSVHKKPCKRWAGKARQLYHSTIP